MYELLFRRVLPFAKAEPLDSIITDDDDTPLRKAWYYNLGTLKITHYPNSSMWIRDASGNVIAVANKYHGTDYPLGKRWKTRRFIRQEVKRYLSSLP